MKKIFLIVTIFCLLIPFAYAQTHSLKLSTQYPAPYGEYEKLTTKTLNIEARQPPADINENCTIGDMFYDNTNFNTWFCNREAIAYGAYGVTYGGKWGRMISAWKKDTDDVFLTDWTNVNLFVGIGLDNPSAKLHIKDGAILAIGSTGYAPTSGASTRFMWVPDKAALRAGEVSGTQWNSSYIGTHSLATGYDTTASGTYSTALGNATTASGSGSFASGTSSSATNTNATAIGTSASASGLGSFSAGESTAANGTNAVALGKSTTASGNYSVALGQGIAVSGINSVGVALNNQAGTTVSQANTMSIMGGSVGIGSAAPTAKLTLKDGSFLIEGTTGGTPVSGAGTRFMWIPAKKALRAGLIDADQWDDSNIGLLSTIAGGDNSKANGLAAFIGSGTHNEVRDNYSTIAGGHTNKIIGYDSPYPQAEFDFIGGGQENYIKHAVSTIGGGYSNLIYSYGNTIAGGIDNTAGINDQSAGSGDPNVWPSGAATIGGGFRNQSIEDYATVAGGSENIASNSNSSIGGGYSNECSGVSCTIAGGYNSTANAAYSSVVGGYQNLASGRSSVAMNELTTASGNYSTAMGKSTIAAADESVALGGYTTARAYKELVIGKYNLLNPNANKTGWRDEDPIFEVGVGSSSSDPRNVITAYKNSHVAIGIQAAGVYQIFHNAVVDILGDINVEGCYRLNERGLTPGTILGGSCASDLRLKKNIEPLTHSLDKILQLQPISYNPIDGPEDSMKMHGLIAQDVEEIFPDWVNTDDKGYKKINYGLQIQMHLIEATKELNQKLQEETNALKEENNSLRQMLEEQHQEIEKLKDKINSL